MTAAERQRAHRERLGIGGPWLRSYRPWDDALSDNRRESETIDRIEEWLDKGDIGAVTKWLSLWLWGRNGGESPDEVLEHLRAEFKRQEDEAAA